MVASGTTLHENSFDALPADPDEAAKGVLTYGQVFN
jgi:hypothetical protein